MRKICQLPPEKILFLKADVNYTIFHLKDGKKVMSSTTLKRHASELYLSRFLRVSKSFLLNPVFIESIEKVGKHATVKMTNGSQMKISRRRLSIIENIRI
jgi:DNA-binding LytR/AlgR family response regulator